MKYLYIIRHAKSSWEEADLPDVVRPLNERGKKAAVKIGNYLAQHHEKPDLILSSPATRAFHTAVTVSQILGYRLKHIDVRPEIYFEGEPGVLNVLRELDDKYEQVFVFGHEPTCSDLIYSLANEMVYKFPTASVFKIKLDIDNWADLFEAKGKKAFFISPKTLKD